MLAPTSPSSPMEGHLVSEITIVETNSSHCSKNGIDLGVEYVRVGKAVVGVYVSNGVTVSQSVDQRDCVVFAGVGEDG